LSDIAEEDEDEGEESKSLEPAPSNDLPVVMRKHDNPPTPLHVTLFVFFSFVDIFRFFLIRNPL